MIALSWSRISDYRQCPHKFDLKYIQKVPNFQMKEEEKSPHLVRGGNVHKQLENYVVKKLKGEIPNVTMPEVLGTIPLIDNIMSNYNVIPENQIAIDENFKITDWYSKTAYFRVIYDLIGFGKSLLLVDYKTGKLSDYSGSMDELGQLHFSALIGMSLWPEYDRCDTVYLYVDHKKPVKISFDRSDLEPMKEKLIEEHRLINEEQEFKPTRNQFCKWCDSTRQQCINSKK
jgi:CRISPR/Cas system-associated exonuclease Cas4 (RecB family)